MMVGSMLPLSLLINYFLFDGRYTSEAPVFLWATLVTFLLLCLLFTLCGAVAISLRTRFPNESELYKRLSICITLFILMSGVYLSIVCKTYELFHFAGYEFDENGFTKAYASLVVINIFLTFLNEGIYSFENYRQTISETEQLKKEFMQSQLLGLKSQVNPHFLFNSLNTLSSLIHEDAGTAEDFLDHMSKVYRYLLRNNDDQLVELCTELNFVNSYYFLLKARHGDALKVEFLIEPSCTGEMLPPLTLQMIIEHAIGQNTMSRTHPLIIRISADKQCVLVWNNVQPRMNNAEFTEGIDNIRKKYKLLSQEKVEIVETETERMIRLPLLKIKQTEPA
jgi:two-component system, LytTR family, sensor kinase